MNAVLGWATMFSLLCIALGMVLAAWRLLRGPGAQDRVLALDAMYVCAMLLLVVLGGLFVVEALSVLIQVFSFQTFRKRVFLMAPIHHHFEMMAWSETKIILRFWIVAAVCSAIGFTIYQASIS